MKSKNLLFVASLFAAFLLSSCNKDPIEVLPGTWTIENGGTITFNSDGTGVTEGSDEFNFDCGTLNGVMYGPYPEFTWEVVQDNEDVLKAYFSHEETGSSGVNCSATYSYSMKIKSKNKIQLGEKNVLVDLSFIITKN